MESLDCIRLLNSEIYEGFRTYFPGIEELHMNGGHSAQRIFENRRLLCPTSLELSWDTSL